MTALLVRIIVVALIFDYTNGFHDAANAVAIPISTRALSARVALLMAAVMNVLGALVSTNVARTIGHGIIEPSPGHTGLSIVLAALVGAIIWNLITWRLGLPSSSSHALIGGLIGSALAASHSVHWRSAVTSVIVPMVVSPLIGLALGYLTLIASLWIFRQANYHRAQTGFRRAQVLSSAATAFGHGSQDGQKTMGVITLSLVVAGRQSPDAAVPLWVIFAAASAISLGTCSGGWRVIRTVGSRVYSLSPDSGFAAQSVSSVVMLGAARFGWPVSTTHVLTTSVMGVGAATRLTAVRWGVATNIMIAWLLTIPAAAAIAAAVCASTRLL
ncbi:MAG: putative low-affinity phosphate transport protein [Pseudonocardiales bacterium]|nr:putative low-affinity phosphate transport protein [Pseudonocardiales bacterium]